MASFNAPRRLPRPVGGAFAIKDFRFLWASGTFDNSCRWMDTVVMGLLVLELTDSPFQVALLFVLRWVPMLVFAIFSGMLASHANRMLILTVSRTGTVLVTAAMLGLVTADMVQAWHIMLASLALGWLYVLEFPSRRSLIYDVVGERLIVPAMSLETISTTLGRFIGPLTAGLLIEFWGYGGTYSVLVSGYILALLVIVLVSGRVPARAPAVKSLWQEIVGGLRYSFRNRVIRGVLGVTLIMNALAFSAEALFPVVARDHLHVGAGLTGFLISAQAIGSLVAATFIANLVVTNYYGRIFCLGITLQLVSLLFFALSPWYGLSFGMMLLLGMGSAGFSSMQSTIILISAAPEMRGIALGVLGQCIGVAALGGLGIGVVASLFSAHVAIALSASLGILLMLPVVSLSPLVRSRITPGEEASVAGGGPSREAPESLD